VAAVAAAFGLVGVSAIPAHAQQQPSSMPSAAAPMKDQAKPAAKKAMAKKNMGSKEVMDLQAALNKAGASLKVDGKLGKATIAALKKYQAANGLAVTGKDDKATRTKLGLTA
jgi:peptidoglycan hydrolase-like protein with peptidoglycan-binding domain